MAKKYKITFTHPETGKVYVGETDQDPDTLSKSEKINIALGIANIGLVTYGTVGEAIGDIIENVISG